MTFEGYFMVFLIVFMQWGLFKLQLWFNCDPLNYLRAAIVAEAEINPPGSQVSPNNASSSNVMPNTFTCGSSRLNYEVKHRVWMKCEASRAPSRAWKRFLRGAWRWFLWVCQIHKLPSGWFWPWCCNNRHRNISLPLSAHARTEVLSTYPVSLY